MVNEAIHYYNSGGSLLHIVSLDAAKAFDKLWRAGLFFKLIGEISQVMWRAAYIYYSISMIIVSLNGEQGRLIKTSEGVKQGGTLSPHLFNFFMNKLLVDCINKNIGARVGPVNVSIIAYCDDILLMSPVSGHINILLDACAEYAGKWKLEFNSSKSEHYITGPRERECKTQFMLNGTAIPRVDSLVYLGLPIGEQAFINDFFASKFSKTERSLYSLRPMGCKPFMLSPNNVAYIYKQYCQSQFKYGLEVLHIDKTCLKEIETRQNILVKNSIGLGKYCLTTPLFDSLKIESIKQLYMKHKVFFVKQIETNVLTKTLFSFLDEFYRHHKIPRGSFVAQCNEVERYAGTLGHTTSPKELITQIETLHRCDNAGLVDTVKFYLYLMGSTREFSELTAIVKHLKALLNYEH